MNYIGSKYTLLPFLDRVYRHIADGDEKVFCDIFAGTAAVGRHFKRLGLKVISNDLQYYAYALNKAYIEINETPSFTGLRKKYRGRASFDDQVESVLAFINGLPGKSGFVSDNYGPAGNRLYYTRENAEKADAIRQAIERWRARMIITEHEFFYVLCSLLEAVDQVANTTLDLNAGVNVAVKGDTMFLPAADGNVRAYRYTGNWNAMTPEPGYPVLLAGTVSPFFGVALRATGSRLAGGGGIGFLFELQTNNPAGMTAWRVPAAATAPPQCASTACGCEPRTKLQAALAAAVHGTASRESARPGRPPRRRHHLRHPTAGASPV